MSPLDALSIVVPTLNAGGHLRATLEAVLGRVGQVIVADGGSTDATLAIAAAHGVRVIPAQAGRGAQLARGIAETDGTWVMLLHADTVLAPGWHLAAARFMAAPVNASRAGYFRLRLDDSGPQARRIERLAAWRCRRLGLPYGDQGLLLSRALLEAVDGVAPLPLMEDVDLVRRIGRARLVPLPCDAVTSADRYRRDGWWWRPARNMLLLALYFAGVRPGLLARLYG